MITVQLIAAAVTLAATPIASAPREAAPAAPAQSEQAAKKPTRYCVVDTVTGSRIRQKTCLTRAEWMEQGIDPLADK